MKGFARILETLLASIMVLTSLSFFLAAPVPRSNWDVASAEIRAQEALITGVRSGIIPTYVQSNNYTGMRTLLETMFTRSTDFSVEIFGIPSPVTYVGCADCDPGEKADLETRLQPANFPYHDRALELRVEQMTVTNIPPDTSILAFMSFADLNVNYGQPDAKNAMEKFLENGGGIMLLGDLSQAQAAAPVIRDWFNLSWHAVGVPVDTGSFIGYNDPENTSFRVALYYENISGIPAAAGLFSHFTTAGVNQIEPTNRTVIRDNSGVFSFAASNRNVVNGNGRTFWIAGNDRSDSINNLTRAAVLWVAGERFRFDGPARKILPRTTRQARIIVYDHDPYELRLTSWDIF